MKPPSASPVYCAIYPELAELARAHGYALAVHGSMASDFDLVAIPWAALAADPDEFILAVVRSFAFDLHDKPVAKEHGRVVYSLLGRHGWCGHIDLSFMPRVLDHSRCCRQCGCNHSLSRCSTARLCGDCREFDEDMPRIGGGK